METVSQALMGISDPRQSFCNESKIAFNALSDLSPQTLEMTLRSLLWIGANIAIDNPNALAITVSAVKEAVEQNPDGQASFIEMLSKKIFRE